MIKSKYITMLVAVVMCLALAASFGMAAFASTAEAQTTEYEKKLFNGEIVTMDIEVDPEDWQSLLDNAQAKEYISADLVINGERFATVGIRTKGNSSLSQAGSSDTGRYSLQLNPNKYVKGQSFYGLDTMCINNLTGDATYMKDAISYDIMNFLDVPSPLYNYANVTVNGEAYGLFLLLERYDDSFLDRVYNTTSGELYNVKVQMGERSDFAAGNRENSPQGFGQGGIQMPGQEGEMQTPPTGGAPPDGNGQTGEGTSLSGSSGQGDMQPPEGAGALPDGNGQMGEGMSSSSSSGQGDTQPPEGMQGQTGEGQTLPEEATQGENGETETANTPEQGGMQAPGGGGGMGGFSSGGGNLVYTDDDPASYGSIFNNAVSSKVSDNDQQQVITAIQKLNEGEDLEQYWDVDEILRYLAAHTFVVNLDSYISSMQQNYYLYERNGLISILSWDYNLAFGGFQNGSASNFVNFPIDTPVSGVNMEDRPLVNTLLSVEEYKERYHEYLNQIVEEYVNGGLFAAEVERIDTEIGEDVKTDATAYFTYEQYQNALTVFDSLMVLRAQSVAGQLNGSIPSTTQGQSESPNLLVDTGDISISDLGSMGGGGGGGDRGGGGFGGQQTTAAEGQQANVGQGGMPNMQGMQQLLQAAQSGEQTDEQRAELEAMGFTEEELERFLQMGQGGGANMDGGQTSGTAQGQSLQTWVLYGVLGAVLLFAIAFLWFAKRRKSM